MIGRCSLRKEALRNEISQGEALEEPSKVEVGPRTFTLLHRGNWS